MTKVTFTAEIRTTKNTVGQALEDMMHRNEWRRFGYADIPRHGARFGVLTRSGEYVNFTALDTESTGDVWCGWNRVVKIPFQPVEAVSITVT